MEPRGGCLCIGCLEKRLGRKLRPKDFQRDHPFNRPNVPGTPRLMKREPSLVHFRQIYTLPLEFISEFAAGRGPRLRLKSPYREALAHRFGGFFQRVGLPFEVEI
jgi:hypothetical protein